MAVQRTACVVLTCDACEEPLGAGDGGTWHFGDTVEAYNAARSLGWYAERDRMVCDDCLVIRGCELCGHQWSEWDQPPSVLDPGQWVRVCEACARVEYDPPLLPGAIA